jgi:Flp pilus assembly pilin Flp
MCAFTVNFDHDLFTIQRLVEKCASAANRKRHPMLKQMRRFLKDQSGTATIEYGLIASGISVVIIPSVNNVGANSSKSSPLCKTRFKLQAQFTLQTIFGILKPWPKGWNFFSEMWAGEQV